MPGDFGAPDGGLRLPAPPSGVSTTSQAAAAAKELRRNQRRLSGNQVRSARATRTIQAQLDVSYPFSYDWSNVLGATATYESGVLRLNPAIKGRWSVTADFSISDGVGGLNWAVSCRAPLGAGAGGVDAGVSVAAFALTLDTTYEGYAGGPSPIAVGASPQGADPAGSWTATITGHLLDEGFPV